MHTQKDHTRRELLNRLLMAVVGFGALTVTGCGGIERRQERRQDRQEDRQDD